jgi:hypothetical protein
MTNLIEQTKARAIKGPGLKGVGIVVLQFLLIFIVESFEYAVGKVGIITGIVLVLATIGGLVLGRTGTSLTNAINPPLAFFFSTLFIMSIFGGAGLHPTRIGLDLVTSMASVAPYLIVSALIGWAGYFLTKKSAA